MTPATTEGATMSEAVTDIQAGTTGAEGGEEPSPFMPTYGPTADVSWAGADPTTTLDAARRRGA